MRKKLLLPTVLTLGFISTSCSVFAKPDPTKGSVILSNESGVDVNQEPCQKITYRKNGYKTPSFKTAYFT